jgi:hypothetical protein
MAYDSHPTRSIHLYILLYFKYNDAATCSLMILRRNLDMQEHQKAAHRERKRAMSETQPTNIPRTTVLAELALVPFVDEEDDFQTITTLEDVRDDVFSAIAALPGYTASVGSGATRDAGIILLLGEIAHQAILNKDLIIEICKAGAAAIGLLAKQGHIKRIEVTLDGDTFAIDEPDKITAQRLLDTWEAKHPEKVANPPSAPTLHITSTVSKT